MAKHLDRPDYTPNKLGPNTTRKYNLIQLSRLTILVHQKTR